MRLSVYIAVTEITFTSTGGGFRRCLKQLLSSAGLIPPYHPKLRCCTWMFVTPIVGLIMPPYVVFSMGSVVVVKTRRAVVL